MNRRKFLVRTGIGAGLLIGATVLGKGPARRAIAKQVDEGTIPYNNTFDANVWFELTPQGDLVLHSPKIEMGQGIHTALAQIAAEELETDWQRIRVVHASTSHGPIDPTSTGGSLSVPSLYEPLRELAATMREIIRTNAAKLMGVDVAALTVIDGVVQGGGKKMTFAEVAQQTKNWDTDVETPTLKPTSAFKYIGKPLARVDLTAKVKGEPMFGIDATFPDMLFGSVVRPPVFGAEYMGAEAGKAEQMPGVVKVVIEKTFAGVVARSRVEAEAAKRALKVDWKMPAKLVQQSDVDALIKVGVGDDVVIQQEGSTSSLDQSTGIIERSYQSPLGAHSHIEPNGAAALVQNGKAVVKMSTQVANITRQEIATALGFAETDVELQPQFVGGGFGRRLQTDHAIEAALMSKAVGKPVHVFFERAEEFQNGFLRPPTHHVLKARLSATGTIEALEHQTASADVAFNAPLLGAFLKPLPVSIAPALVGADFGAWRGGLIQYHGIPNYRTVAWHSSLPFRTSWWRGLGLLANTFAIESFMDELAHAAKQDPLAFRLKHLSDDERGNRLKNVLQTAADKAGWGQPLPVGRARGIACSTDVSTPVAQVAEVELQNGQIRVRKVVCAIDPGLIINPDGVKAQTEGGIMMGLSTSLFEEIKIQDGKATPNQFGMYQMAMLKDAPDIEVHLLSSGETPRGVGEPPIGPIGAAIANAFFALTGKRLNQLPLRV